MNPELIRATGAAVTALLAEFPELGDDEQLRADMIEAETDFNEVVRRLVIQAKQAKAHADGIKETLGELSERRERVLHREERIRAIILSLMTTAELRKLPLPEATVALSYRSPRPMKPDSADGLPDEYVKVKREPNWERIKAALAAGEIIPGVVMSNGADVLMIR